MFACRRDPSIVSSNLTDPTFFETLFPAIDLEFPMRLPYLLLIGLFVCTAVISAGCVNTVDTSKENAASEAISMINISLSENADWMTQAADEIAAGKNDADSSKQVLADLYQKSTLAQTILYANENMIVVSVYPDIILSSVGTDQSSYGTNEAYYSGKTIALTEYFHLDDGTNASVLSAPVYDNGTWKGYISMSFDSSRLFGDVEKYLFENYGYHLCVLQTNGLQVYDYDLRERGKNILTDPSYPDDVKTAAMEICRETSGTTKYTYKKTGSDEIVQKTVVWDTLEFGGQTWRVLILAE
ncbi:hypothetical protein Mlab_1002 [Methanocorpusculum labreanum Z]|uniref:Dret-0059-like sensor domain-containing protein n=2 Tax=Methanocorpusculum labreanum TaxID=83984 RepID=A2SS65_METLZ|nr:hypothetical protein Mlab_1002 [Methanocorpusculum labreanum Z]